MRTLLRMISFVGWVCLGAGVLLQLWLKDRHLMTAFFFYAMPKPCLALLATLLVWLGSGRFSRLCAGGAVIALMGWWISASWSAGPPPLAERGGQEFKVLYWNLCRPNGFDEEMVEMVNQRQPDVAAFVEPGPNAAKLAEEYQRRLPGYTVSYIPRGILWVARVPSRLQKRGKLEAMGAFAVFEVNAAFPLVVADVFPHPFRSREPQLREAFEQGQNRSDAILVGDFNTPAESMFYEPYRNQFTNAFEAAGHGFRETWPLGLPLLSLDHVWAGKDWTVVRAEKIHRLRGSDHAALLVTLRR